MAVTLPGHVIEAMQLVSAKQLLTQFFALPASTRVIAMERNIYDRTFVFVLEDRGGQFEHRVTFEAMETLSFQLGSRVNNLFTDAIRNGETFTYRGLPISTDATISQEPILRQPAIVNVTIAVENNNVVSTRKRHLDLGE